MAKKSEKHRKEEENREVSRQKKQKKQQKSGGIGGALDLMLFTGICAGAGAFAGAANFFYKYALTPKKRDPRRDRDPAEKEFVDGMQWLRSRPDREDVWIRSDDGLQLHAHLIPADAGKAGAESDPVPRRGEGPSGRDAGPAERSGLEKQGHRYVICVHGYADTSVIMGIYARVYSGRYGMNVLLPDLRGHGQSDGEYVGMGYDDSRDLLRWIDWILEKDPDARIILHGVSMGAAAVLMTTGHTLPGQVAAAVADSSYTRAVDALSVLYKADPRAVVPAPVMMEAVRGITLVRAGYDLAKAAPVRAVARSKTPTLFIQGQEDEVIPPGMMTALYKAAACPKAFQWFPEAGHVRSVVTDPEAFWARIERFLHAYL